MQCVFLKNTIKGAGRPMQQVLRESCSWHVDGTQCNACCEAARKEWKRMAELAEQKGKQTIEQAFAAAAAKKQKQGVWRAEVERAA